MPTLLNGDDRDSLLRPVTRSEVKDAVWALDSDSAPGPDGFTGLFFKHCWETVGDDIYQAAQDFFAGTPIPWAISSAQIVLIPKTPALATFSDFRPICLCTFVNKIFTRMLSTRIEPFLPRLISPEQSGFLADRDIQENILLAFEMINALEKKCRGANIVIKLDMHKAFDRVSWQFL